MEHQGKNFMGCDYNIDEVFLTINGKRHYLWRAVDQDDNVLDILVQSRRNKKAAKRFFKKLLKGLCYVPRVLITDKLKSYAAAKREVMPGWSIGRVAISTTGVRTRIGRRVSVNDACSGSSPPVMPSGSCQRTASSPNTSDPGGICCQRRCTAMRCGIASRVGPKLRARSGLPKRQGGPGSVPMCLMTGSASIS